MTTNGHNGAKQDDEIDRDDFRARLRTYGEFLPWLREAAIIGGSGLVVWRLFELFDSLSTR